MATSGRIRLGGRSDLPSGDIVVWAVADGQRGRRWRESTTRDGSVLRAVLVETEPAGDIHRLEVATDAGLLTVHPDGTGGTLHGNVVTSGGMRHLTFDWGPDRAILVDGSPALTAIALRTLGRDLAPGRMRQIETLWIDDLLVPEAGGLEMTRVDERSWRLSGSTVGAGEVVVSLDDDSLLTLPDRTVWPLES